MYEKITCRLNDIQTKKKKAASPTVQANSQLLKPPTQHRDVL